jgi:hypothetical protein
LVKYVMYFILPTKYFYRKAHCLYKMQSIIIGVDWHTTWPEIKYNVLDMTQKCSRRG